MQLLNGHALRVHDLAFAPDGRSLASCSLDGTVRVWDVAAGTGTVLLQVAERNEFDTRRPALGFDRLAFAGAGPHLVCRSQTDGMEVWDLGARYRRAQLLRRRPEIYESELAVTPGGLVATNVWSADPFHTEVRLWDCETLHERVLCRTPEAVSLSGLAFDPSGRFLATNAGVFDVATEEQVLEVLLWGDVLRWSPDGALIAGGEQHEGVQVIEADTGEPVASVTVRDTGKPQFQFSPCGAHLAVIDRETVQVWDTTTWAKRREFAWKVGRLTCLAFSPDGQVAAVGTGRGSILLWDWDL